MPSMLHMLQFVLHIWNTLLLAVEEVPTLQLLVCWLGGYGGWKSMVLVWRRRRWVEWLQSGGPWLHRAQTWVWMQISTVSWEENAISIHNERGTGSWTWLQHNYIEKKCTLTNCVLLQLWNQSIQYGWHGHMGKKTACTSSAESGMHIVHFGVVSWASSSIGGIHTASSFHIIIRCFLDGNHIWSPHNSMCSITTWSFNISSFCKWVYDFFFPALKHSPKPMRGLLQMLAHKGLV